MRGFPAKLMAAVLVAVFLLVGDFPTTSALLPSGGRKSLWLVHSRDVSMKMFPREEGSSEGLNIDSNKLFPFGCIREKILSPPPSPIRNGQSSWRMPAPSAPPPQSL